MERLLTRLKYPLPLFSLQFLPILGVGRLRLRDPLRGPRDRSYRTQREELEKTLNSYHMHSEETIPIDCAIESDCLVVNDAAKKVLYKHDRSQKYHYSIGPSASV